MPGAARIYGLPKTLGFGRGLITGLGCGEFHRVDRREQVRRRATAVRGSSARRARGAAPASGTAPEPPRVALPPRARSLLTDAFRREPGRCAGYASERSWVRRRRRRIFERRRAAVLWQRLALDSRWRRVPFPRPSAEVLCRKAIRETGWPPALRDRAKSRVDPQH